LAETKVEHVETGLDGGEYREVISVGGDASIVVIVFWLLAVFVMQKL
jgi:hypothetical protein